METIVAALITGVLASLITAVFTKSTADKKNAIENITQERKKWRDDLRGATVALRRYFENKDRFCSKGNATDGKENCGIVFHSAAEAKAFFEVRLNLSDKEDCKLMAILDMLAHKDASTTYELSSQWVDYRFWGDGENISVMELLAYFEEGMSHNLKYDWERAKREVNGKGLIKWIAVIVALLAISFCHAKSDSLNNELPLKSESIETSIERSIETTDSNDIKCSEGRIHKCSCVLKNSKRLKSKMKVDYSKKDSLAVENRRAVNVNVFCTNLSNSNDEESNLNETNSVVAFVEKKLDEKLKNGIWNFIGEEGCVILIFLILFGLLNSLLKTLLKFLHKLLGLSPKQNKYCVYIAHSFNIPYRIKLEKKEINEDC